MQFCTESPIKSTTDGLVLEETNWLILRIEEFFSDFEDALQTHEAAYRIYFIRFTFSLFYNTVFYFFKELA